MIRAILTVTFIVILWSAATADSAKIAELEKKLIKARDTVRVNTLLDLATEYEYIDRKKAILFAEQAYEQAISIKYLTGEVRGLYEMVIISFLQGDRPKALNYITRGLALSNQMEDKSLIASGYFHLSHYYEEESNYPEAINYLDQALSIYMESDNQIRISQCYSSFGGIYKTLGNYEDALSFYFKALAIKEELDDRRGMSIIYSNIGGVYLLTSVYSNVSETYLLASKLDEALQYFSKALKIDRSNDDNEGIVFNLTKIGVAYQKSGQFEIALQFYDTALVMAKDLDFEIDESILLGNIGSTLRAQSRYQESLDYLFSALELKVKLQRPGSAAHTCNDICETYLALEDYSEAKKYALKAIDLATNVDIDQQRVGLYFLADCEYKLNDFKNAYDHLEAANIITDSIFTIESNAKMQEMELKYKSDKKEQEIENLKATNETARYRNISFAGAAISFLILGGLLYYVQRMRTRRNRLLLEKEKELDRLKSRFFANVSHEFRTPLTLILGPLDELISKIDLPDMKKQLKVMKRNAERLLDLVNQLLDLSKIESGKLKLSVSRSDIISVIRGVSMSFHSMAEQKHIDLQLDVQPDRLELNYDREKLETIMTNLLSNAFKFTPVHGQIVIRTLVQPEKDIDKRSHLSIVVYDSGSGIPEEEINLIFNRFYQSDHNQLLQQEGSGIGLALTKELVELHGGMISAQSQPGKGTQIRFTIPMDIELPEPIQTTNQAFESEKVFTTHEVNEGEFESVSEGDQNLPLVLLIEDHVDVRNYIREILGKHYRVLIAEDGEKGVSIAYESIPDLIISDVMMPTKDGFEVCRELKQDEKTSHIPIILLTAKSESDDKIEGLETQADDYITKPFVPKELLARIKNLIDSRGQLREKYKREGILRPRDVAVNSVDELFLNRMVALVESNIGNELFGVEQLGNALGMSRSQLHRKLTALIDQGPNQFIRTFRLQRAHDLLKQKAATASEIAYQVGFSSPSYFTKCFHEQYGYTPSEIPG